jgi:hypothetical protein
MNVYLVNKNSDFTEGKGYMLVHKAFATLSLAQAYVKDQIGIYGSAQYDKPSHSIPSDACTGAGKEEYWNGYSIETMIVIHKYDTGAITQKKKQIADLKAELCKLENELALDS